MGNSPMTAKADLHVHSKASNRPTEWVLRQFGAPESFTEPREVYRLCRERGMDFVTLSDHDTIAGALEIAHLPGTFLSEEVTVEFPEDGCEIHCLVIGISEVQHCDIQELRRNVYELRDYLEERGIVHSVAHPLFRVNDMLTLDQVEKLLVLFNRFEGLNDPRFWQRFGLGGGFKFLYVGRVSREKNLDALLAAFLDFLAGGRRAELVVVGDGPCLKDLAHRFRRPEILFTGFLHGEDLARAYAGADLFVFPSTSDTFGNVVLEAQAAGLPAIVSDRGGPRQIVLPGQSGLVVDTELPGALSAAMARLFDDPAKLAEMAGRAVEHARRHSWELLLERLFESLAMAPAALAVPAPAGGGADGLAAGCDRPAAPTAGEAPLVDAFALPMRNTIAAWHHRQS
jgi:glycosyltransferase involved in cell wall biosynthesis